MKTIFVYEEKKIKLKAIKPGQIFIHGRSVYLCDNSFYFVNIKCGTIKIAKNFARGDETLVRLAQKIKFGR